jgi:hypothetical protein
MTPTDAPRIPPPDDLVIRGVIHPDGEWTLNELLLFVNELSDDGFVHWNARKYAKSF